MTTNEIIASAIHQAQLIEGIDFIQEAFDVDRSTACQIAEYICDSTANMMKGFQDIGLRKGLAFMTREVENTRKLAEWSIEFLKDETL